MNTDEIAYKKTKDIKFNNSFYWLLPVYNLASFLFNLLRHPDASHFKLSSLGVCVYLLVFVLVLIYIYVPIIAAFIRVMYRCMAIPCVNPVVPFKILVRLFKLPAEIIAKYSWFKFVYYGMLVLFFAGHLLLKIILGD